METVTQDEESCQGRATGAAWRAVAETLASEVASARRRLAEVERLLLLLASPGSPGGRARQHTPAARDDQPSASPPVLRLVPPGEACPVRLTPREAEVLRLLAAGRSNREMAAALCRSERTVERHLGSLYRKIAARNRAEATAFALRHGLA